MDPVPQGGPSDEVVRRALRRFKRCSEWEATARERFVNDIKFANGDDANGYQWPNNIMQNRDVNNKPCLTLNIVRQHNLIISNQARQNKSSVKFIPLGNGATSEAANVYNDIMRHIEYQSRAQSAYSIGRKFQIDGGIGWWRIGTDWVPGTMEQEIYIWPVLDPLAVYMDPDCKQTDCSDGEFAFYFDVVPRDKFGDAYPKYKDKATLSPLGDVSMAYDGFLTDDSVVICEYFEKTKKEDTLVSFVHLGERKTARLSGLPKALHKPILEGIGTRSRNFEEDVVEWKLIVGEEVIDETVWPGKYIPLVRIIGEETVIEGIMDRKGHTRGMKDAQRMYNYNASSQVEFVALQGKTPWLAAAKAIEELESMWNTANTANHSVLVWNSVDDDNPDRPVPPPMRIDPPNASPGFQAGMDTAFQQMMMTSGQWQNQMGMMGNERTGKAIGLRQQQSDTATFHFQDNYEDGLIYTGRQILDLIPKIYDTTRVMQILADDGADYELVIDPSAREAYFEELDHQGHVIRRVLNPQKGKYDVASTVGPAVASKQQETADALTLVLTQAPDLIPLIGDLLLKALPFDGALEAAQRMKRMVPQQALGKGPTLQEQQMSAQIQQLSAALAESLQKQGKNELKLVGKDQMRDIDVYEAETKRMAALQKMLPMDSEGLEQIIRQLVEETMMTSLQPIIEANQYGTTEQSGDPNPAPPEHLGAKLAPDGHYYLPHPAIPGQFLRVTPRSQANA